MQPLKWVEQAEQRIKENNEEMAELDKISSCDYRAYQSAAVFTVRYRHENALLIEGINTIKGLLNDRAK